MVPIKSIQAKLCTGSKYVVVSAVAGLAMGQTEVPDTVINLHMTPDQARLLRDQLARLLNLPPISQTPVSREKVTTIGFGKYRGTPLDQLPEHYVSWLLEQPWVHEKYPELAERLERIDEEGGSAVTPKHRSTFSSYEENESPGWDADDVPF